MMNEHAGAGRKLMRRALTVALGLSACLLSAHLLPGSASAQTAIPGGAREATDETPMVPDTMETARGLAMGLGARASAMSTNGIAYNPAGLSIGRHYHIDSSVGYDPQAARFWAGGSLADSHSGPINMGVNFRYVHGSGERGSYGGYDGRVALGLPLGEHFALGLTGRYMSFWREGAGNEEAAPFAEHVTFDAAIRVTPIPGLHIAALGHNLIDVGSPLVPMQVGGSISYTIDSAFTLAFDGLADLTTWQNPDGTIRPEAMIGGAAEYFTGEVPIRAGYIYDSGRDLHYVTAGSGWLNEQLGFDLSLRQQVNGAYDTRMMASFRYFVH